MENNYNLVESVEYHPNGQITTVTINTELGNQKQFYIRTEQVVNNAINNSR